MDDIRPKFEKTEIDLSQLVFDLWHQKSLIIGITVLSLLAAIIHLILTPPTYTASIQIEAPLSAELAPINNTELLIVTPESAFSDLLQALKSDNQQVILAEQETMLLAKIYSVKEEEINSGSINLNSLYSINYPIANKQNNSFTPKIYEITTQGHNRELLKQLLSKSINLASHQIISKWKMEHTKARSEQILKLEKDFFTLYKAIEKRTQNEILKLKEKQSLEQKKIKDELDSRKFFVLESREKRIIELQEALKIAKRLNILTPTTFNQLDDQKQNSSQIEINTEIRNLNEPLYLRGSRILEAELESLRNLADDKLLDTRVIELEAQLSKALKNRDIEILQSRKNESPFNTELQRIQEHLHKVRSSKFPEAFTLKFYNSEAISPSMPIKPKKTLILSASVLAGSILGLCLSLGTIALKRQRASDKAG